MTGVTIKRGETMAMKRGALRGIGVVAALLCGTAAVAQPSTNATANLIRLLIEQKVITAEAGQALLTQAEAEAATARAAQAPVTTADATLPAPAAGTIRVPYIPESLRAKITEDIRKDVLAQADFEGWARPNQIPEWVKGVRLSGDMRFRSQSEFYDGNNALGLIDYQAFNDSGPINVAAAPSSTAFPLLNTRFDRDNRLRIRARLGLLAVISDQVTAGFRLASGDDNSPISTNQILGGGLAKKDIWLDQAYLKLTPLPYLTASFGRFPNPFTSTDILFDNDLNFDGVVATVDARKFAPAGTRLEVTAGAFPLGFTSNGFPTNSDNKIGDDSRWLFSGQVKAGITIAETFAVDAAAAYHSFKSVQGVLSEPCVLTANIRQCSSDQRRPTFLRKGNTVFLTRDILPEIPGATSFAQPQLLGLSFDYDVLDLNLAVKFPVTETIGVEVSGNYLRNLAFDTNDLCRSLAQNGRRRGPINNIEVSVGGNVDVCSAPVGDVAARYDGGNEGYMVRALFGTARPKKFGEWNVELSYRYLESDATLDSLVDSDFHLGGTNTKGYTVGGAFGLFKNVTIGGRWLSANEISGPPLAIDVLQIDLQAAF